jgi:hypothetical protein
MNRHPEYPEQAFESLKKVKDFIFEARVKLDTPDGFTASIYDDLCIIERKIDKLLKEGFEAYKRRWE